MLTLHPEFGRLLRRCRDDSDITRKINQSTITYYNIDAGASSVHPSPVSSPTEHHLDVLHARRPSL